MVPKTGSDGEDEGNEADAPRGEASQSKTAWQTAQDLASCLAMTIGP